MIIMMYFPRAINDRPYKYKWGLSYENDKNRLYNGSRL